MSQEYRQGQSVPAAGAVGPVVQGVDGDGNVVPVALDHAGRLRPAKVTPVEQLLELLLLETRAVRIGMELLNNMQPGDLISLAKVEGS